MHEINKFTKVLLTGLYKDTEGNLKPVFILRQFLARDLYVTLRNNKLVAFEPFVMPIMIEEIDEEKLEKIFNANHKKGSVIVLDESNNFSVLSDEHFVDAGNYLKDDLIGIITEHVTYSLANGFHKLSQFNISIKGPCVSL